MSAALKTLAMCVFGLLFVSGSVHAQVTVFLDFVTDSHDGSGGAANGTADWIDELNQATAAAGVANFDSTERGTIQTNIEAQLNTIYSAYNVTFTTTSPGGTFDTLYFGVEAGGGVLGFAPLDIGNLFSSQTSNVAPEAFGFFIESGDARATQISEISLGLSGTGAHELGHSFGLLHHHSYSNAGITPANYGATGGLQNNHVIATGSTGLTELGRETLRTISPFSQVMYDISGGARDVFGQDNQSLVTGGIVSDRTEDLGGDAGATTGTAQAMLFSTGPTSGAEIGWVEADIDGAVTDVDVYSFVASSAGTLSAHMYSTDLVYGDAGEFDGMLELIDTNGTTVLATQDDVHYDGNVYDSGTFRDQDPFLSNVTIASAGTYYLRVTPVSSVPIGGNYWLVAAFTPSSAIPEPGVFGLLGVATCLLLLHRRRNDTN